MSANLCVVLEHADGKLRRGSLETLALGRAIAAKFGGAVEAVLLGTNLGSLAAEATRRGADELIAIESELLESYTPDAWRQALVAVIRERQPSWVLMSHSYLAQDLLPLVSAAFEAPVISDAVGVELDAEQPVFLRQPYDAKLIARTIDRGPAPHFATLQSGAFTIDDLPTDHAGKTTVLSPAIDANLVRRRVQEIRATGGKSVDLSGADIIVAGGRGLGSKEKFADLIGGLAKAFGGQIGASRPVVDSEWLPHEHQIGSSGQIVAPRLYLAVGISGAIQHCVGMRGAQTVVAINKDPQAPIFNEATYGIVGDLHELVPALIKAVEEAKGA